MSDTTSGGRKAAKPKREPKPAGQTAGRAKRAGSGGAAGQESAATRSYAYASAEEAQKALRRAVSGFAKAGIALDVRMEGATLTLRLPSKDQQPEELKKLTRRLKPKAERGAKRKKAAAEAGGESGGSGGAE